MNGETNLKKLLTSMKPERQPGDYVFCTVPGINAIDPQNIIGLFKENEATTIITKKEQADKLALSYSFVAAWITLTVHSSLEAVGLTAAFATALAQEDISCNVVAAFYHDHIFVNKNDVEKAMHVLHKMSKP